VNTNKKIQKSTEYFIFLLKMPRLTEIQSAQIVARGGIESERDWARAWERALHEIWHEISQESIRACINIQEHL